jgi:hypothetical protein
MPWKIGKNYLIRTVTMIDVGQLVMVTDHEIVLEKAAWIAETERFTQCLANGEYREVEMFPADKQVILGRGSIIDAVEIENLPTKQK